ncbi:RNA polymerase sigma factor [Sphingomonas sp.]|uniref:RNA polymerase sigma factor n=1 Tax=Sphingomonas sp. TaxID=28214 RepID=UPI002DD69CA2|nr:sigma-70 family RNA polymerase sigma factor [Sphingomonas sp.]
METRRQTGEPDGPATAPTLEQLVARYRTPLVRFFAKRAKPNQDPEDLAQEVFSRLAAREGGPAVDNPEAFLFQIASNLLRDEGRRESTRRAAADTLERHGEGNFEDRSPERVLRGREQVRALHNALNELPERTRAIFVLNRFEELRYGEIAHRLGVSTSTVEKSMTDAIRHLHHRLRQH